MKKEQVQQELSKLIQAGKTKEAFDYLKSQALDKVTSHNCSLIEAEFNILRQDEQKGVITYQERQLRLNRINDKLLNLLAAPAPTGIKSYFASPLLKILIPFAILTACILLWFKLNFEPFACPEYPDNFNNKVLVLPFQKLSGDDVNVHLALQNEINRITQKNELSTIARIGDERKNLNPQVAASLAEQCGANLIVWGTYTDGKDSTRLILQYHFTYNPDWDEHGHLITLKDITGLQKGNMLKGMQDVLMSLCGIIAVREGNAPLAQKWFNKVKEKDKLDVRVLEQLNVKK